MRARVGAFLATALLLVWGCRGTAPPAPLPEGWMSLREPLPAFAGLYRLNCCGRRGLLMAVRMEGPRLALTVTAPPGKVVLEVWAEGEAGFAFDRDQECVVPLSGGELQLGPEIALPVDLRTMGVLLTGRLPAAARELGQLPGWVEDASGVTWLRARVTGPEPRVATVQVGRINETGVGLVAELGEWQGAVPGSLTLEIGNRKAQLRLLSQSTAQIGGPPPWLGRPACGGVR